MKKTYTVVTPIEHDNTRIEPGQSVEMEEDAAEGLLRVGAIAEPVAAAAQDVPADEGRLAAIRSAIGMLDAADSPAWTADGKPKTEAIAAVTGWNVSGAERDAAWATINA